MNYDEKCKNEEKDHDIWIPPSKSGLSNGEVIIPSYYQKKIQFINNGNTYETICVKINYLTIIKDDIRNLRKLNKYQLSYIKYDIDDNSKNEIIDIFNHSIGSVSDLFTNS